MLDCDGLRGFVLPLLHTPCFCVSDYLTIRLDGDSIRIRLVSTRLDSKHRSMSLGIVMLQVIDVLCA